MPVIDTNGKSTDQIIEAEVAALRSMWQADQVVFEADEKLRKIKIDIDLTINK